MMRPLILLLLFAFALPAVAQTPAPERFEAPAPKKAFALSLLVPGLGHRYANGGSWDGTASVLAAVETGLWLNLIGTEWRRRQLVNSYETLAAQRADALVEGKDRAFFLNLATYRSSDEYLEISLRQRAWEQLDYVDTRAYQWDWQSEADFLEFRDLREAAESRRRRRPLLAALLVGNRLAAGILAVRRAQSVGDAAVEVALGAPPETADLPTLNLSVRF